MDTPNPGAGRGVPASAPARSHSHARNLAAVAVGGFCGAALRVGLGLWFPDAPGFPATTLAINVSGTAALAALTSYWQATHRGPGWLRAGIGTGLLGAFTTFSALVLFALGTTPLQAALNLALSLVLCAATAWASMSWVERSHSGREKSAQARPNPPGAGNPHAKGMP